jgi:hypothetical protein
LNVVFKNKIAGLGSAGMHGMMVKEQGAKVWDAQGLKALACIGTLMI